jgi:hypothetical protein
MIPVPCRLNFFLARSVPTAVILRRGPYRWVRMIKWNTDIDTFELGQWFDGRVYESKCDISPDGSLFVFFAAQYNSRSRANPEYGYSGFAWTAVSKPPWYYPLALWPAHDTYQGGGYFKDSQTLILNESSDKPHPDYPPNGLQVLPLHKVAQAGSGSALDGGWIRIANKWKKPHPHLLHILNKFSNGSKSYFLSSKLDNALIPLDRVTWADWDRRGRLVLAKEGKLFWGQIATPNVILHPIMDFNPLKPEPLPLPAWAKLW